METITTKKVKNQCLVKLFFCIFSSIRGVQRVARRRPSEHGKYFQISNDNDNAGANSMYNVAENSEMVLSLSLSTILKMVEDDNILLKLDCEGAEYDILLNATQEEMSRINEIVLEIHTDLHPTFKGKEILENKLKEFGFTMTKSDQVYWYNVDHLGNKFDWKELPYCNQRWKR